MLAEILRDESADRGKDWAVFAISKVRKPSPDVLDAVIDCILLGTFDETGSWGATHALDEFLSFQPALLDTLDDRLPEMVKELARVLTKRAQTEHFVPILSKIPVLPEEVVQYLSPSSKELPQHAREGAIEILLAYGQRKKGPLPPP